ncbi:hypothetical protein Emag_006764 [Eimeria magna]
MTRLTPLPPEGGGAAGEEGAGEEGAGHYALPGAGHKSGRNRRRINSSSSSDRRRFAAGQNEFQGEAQGHLKNAANPHVCQVLETGARTAGVAGAAASPTREGGGGAASVAPASLPPAAATTAAPTTAAAAVVAASRSVPRGRAEDDVAREAATAEAAPEAAPEAVEATEPAGAAETADAEAAADAADEPAEAAPSAVATTQRASPAAAPALAVSPAGAVMRPCSLCSVLRRVFTLLLGKQKLLWLPAFQEPTRSNRCACCSGSKQSRSATCSSCSRNSNIRCFRCNNERQRSARCSVRSGRKHPSDCTKGTANSTGKNSTCPTGRRGSSSRKIEQEGEEGQQQQQEGQQQQREQRSIETNTCKARRPADVDGIHHVCQLQQQQQLRRA